MSVILIEAVYSGSFEEEMVPENSVETETSQYGTLTGFVNHVVFKGIFVEFQLSTLYVKPKVL